MSQRKDQEHFVPVGCELPPDIHTRLKMHCVANKEKLGAWIRVAIEQRLARAERKSA